MRISTISNNLQFIHQQLYHICIVWLGRLGLLFKIVIIIIIMSCYQHRYPWPSPATLFYRPSFPVGLRGYILYRHRAVVCRFKLVVLPLLVHMKGSTGVRCLWVRLYLSSMFRMSSSSNLSSFRDGWYVAVQLLFCGVLPPGLVHYCS